MLIVQTPFTRTNGIQDASALSTGFSLRFLFFWL